MRPGSYRSLRGLGEYVVVLCASLWVAEPGRLDIANSIITFLALCCHRTLASVFPQVVPYSQHIPSFCDEWGFNVALADPDQVQKLCGFLCVN